MLKKWLRPILKVDIKVFFNYHHQQYNNNCLLHSFSDIVKFELKA